jgi:alpha-L-rhamnosidase
MIYFLNRYDAHVSERYSDGVYGSAADNVGGDTAAVDNLWVEIS